ncbi:uncharacterized protein MYCFIDRAFT_173908 [Pseudocercospora fijiensis CIRAD86]|uniref:Uncharacterized protein n=1 Tax=Pseudocercospora fijiensis (strain CIRAD86) TaxID=383855 RepID=M3B6R5_PSEFD|nr:uncharacterized protein MYCFIDRAFT_173908 [Pseudocercospora fijiensis CIRAD86]EME85037.1 hypothetical protein MYCFIDRAFT_173908 [Pseudocercospora fijiensis CIRAD86]
MISWYAYHSAVIPPINPSSSTTLATHHPAYGSKPPYSENSATRSHTGSVVAFPYLHEPNTSRRKTKVDLTVYVPGSHHKGLGMQEFEGSCSPAFACVEECCRSLAIVVFVGTFSFGVVGFGVEGILKADSGARGRFCSENGFLVVYASVVWLILHIVAGEGQLLDCRVWSGVLVTSTVVSHDERSQHGWVFKVLRMDSEDQPIEYFRRASMERELYMYTKRRSANCHMHRLGTNEDPCACL